MVVATLNVCTCPNAKTKQNQILMVAILIQDEYQIIKDVPKPLFKQSFCCTVIYKNIHIYNICLLYNLTEKYFCIFYQ